MSPKELQKTLVISAVAFVVLMSATYLSYRHTKSRTPQIILPGGVTYLGPSSQGSSGQVQTRTITDKIAVPADADWDTWKGQIFPYSFLYPKTLSLGYFPKDPFDAVTIFWEDTNPQENLLLRVEDLNVIPDMKSYVSKSKKEYVQNWWKQYGYTGVESVTPFTNSAGLAGFRALYKTATGVTLAHVFFPVPGKPNLMIWLTDKLLEKEVFDRIVDSVSWKK